MRLQLSTWPEVENYLSRSTGIIIPIGSTEQHGPNGLIGTDALCPELIAHGVGEREGVLVAPTLSIGMAQHHLAFAGSVTLRPSTLIAVVRDVVHSLMRHGFDRFYFLNGHGGNVATVSAAFSEIYADQSFETRGDNRAGVRCTLVNWWGCDGVRRLSAELFGAAEGSHATPSEISLTWHGYPEAVREVAMSPERAPNGPIHDAADYRRRFPDGRIGSNPALANRAAGERLYQAAVDFVCEDYRRFVKAS